MKLTQLIRVSHNFSLSFWRSESKVHDLDPELWWSCLGEVLFLMVDHQRNLCRFPYLDNANFQPCQIKHILMIRMLNCPYCPNLLHTVWRNLLEFPVNPLFKKDVIRLLDTCCMYFLFMNNLKSAFSILHPVRILPFGSSSSWWRHF